VTTFEPFGILVTSDDLWIVATAACCAVACAVLGCFLVLQRLSLLGDAISHAILPGLAVAFILTGSRGVPAMLAGAAVAAMLTAGLSGGLRRVGRIPEDAALGVVFSTLFALGVLLITWVAGRIDLDPGCVLYGLLELVPFDRVELAGWRFRGRSCGWPGHWRCRRSG
jgi:manganese/zinc/iron transport system permease protein